MNKSPLLSTTRKTFVAVELLDLHERSIGRVEGEVISGNISIDGSSNVRRTANLTFITTDSNYRILDTSNSLALNKRISIEIGVLDLTDKDSELVWYPVGIYVLSRSSISATVTQQQITITALDKMSLHNGEVSGKIDATTRLDSESYTPDYYDKITKIEADYQALILDKDNKNKHLDNMIATLNDLFVDVTGANSVLENLVKSLIANCTSAKVSSDKELKKLLEVIKEDVIHLRFDAKRNKITIREIIKYAAIRLGGEKPGKVIINDVPDKIATPITVSKNTVMKKSNILTTMDYNIILKDDTSIELKTKKPLIAGEDYTFAVKGDFAEKTRIRLTIGEGQLIFSNDESRVSENMIVKTFNVMPIANGATRIKIDFVPSGSGHAGKKLYWLALEEGESKNAEIFTKADEVVGSRMIKFIYPTELTLSPGQPLTTVYNSCVDALGGNYEYFYDVHGNFIFQEIKNYLDNTIVPIEDLTSRDYETSYDRTPVQFDFGAHSDIVTSYSNSPDWNNIKNDFSVWGDNGEALIGYRLVIDEKPFVPRYVLDLVGKKKEMDWREYTVHNYDTGMNSTFVGKCYEDDLDRLDHTPYNAVACVVTPKSKKFEYKIYKDGKWETYQNDNVHFEVPQYYPDIKGLWIPDRFQENYEPKEDSTKFKYNFDIIEGSKELSKFSVKTIGTRKEPLQDKSVYQLYPNIIEDIIVYSDDEDLIDIGRAVKHKIKLEDVSEFTNYPPSGNMYKSAFGAIKEQLFKHTSYNEQITITSMPLYDLEVNRRITAQFRKAEINGHYLTKRISFNLDENGSMNLSAIRLNRRDR